MRWRVIADDLTGACDTGAAFAAAGFTTQVLLGSPGGQDFPSGVDVTVLSTASRDMPADQAARTVEQAAAGLPEDTWIYKKIDSTLRGHPVRELAAVMRAAANPTALVCPAFPAQGRTVIDGCLCLHGRPLEETEFAGRVITSDLRRLFSARWISLAQVRRGGQDLINLLREPGVWVADAADPADLETLTRAGLEAGLTLFCGSAGLAGPLARITAASRASQADMITLSLRAAGPILVAAGSQSPVTAAQVARLVERCAALVEIPTCPLQIPAAALDALALRACESLGETNALALVLAQNHEAQSSEAAAALAQAALQMARIVAPAGMVLTGGDTAAAVCQAAGCASIRLAGEVQPGLAWGWLEAGPFAGLPVVTKAGAFGDVNALVQAVQFLADLHQRWLTP